MKTVVEQLREMGIDCDLQRITEDDILESQEERALTLAQELSAMLDHDEHLLVTDLIQLEMQRRAGRQATRRAIANVQRYCKTINRIVKILASAKARRAEQRRYEGSPGHAG